MSGSDAREAPGPAPEIACRLTGPELRERKEGLLRRLETAATAIRVERDAATVVLPGAPDLLATLFEVVGLERECCPFLRFEIEVGPDGAPIRLRMSGPAGTGALLASLGFAAKPGAGRAGEAR